MAGEGTAKVSSGFPLGSLLLFLTTCSRVTKRFSLRVPGACLRRPAQQPCFPQGCFPSATTALLEHWCRGKLEPQTPAFWPSKTPFKPACLLSPGAGRANDASLNCQLYNVAGLHSSQTFFLCPFRQQEPPPAGNDHAERGVFVGQIHLHYCFSWNET